MQKSDDEITSSEQSFSDNSKETAEPYFEKLIKNIVSDDDNVRESALGLISYFECDERLDGYFKKMIQCDQEKLIKTGIIAVGLWGHSNGISYLKEFHQKNKYPEFEEDVLTSIGQIGGIEGLTFLKEYSLKQFDNPSVESSIGMICVEGIALIAMHGHSDAVLFLVEACRHASWNLRECAAGCLGIVFQGREQLPKIVYDTLIQLTKDSNKDVRIAAYVSLDSLIGLDEKNKKILEEARKRQIEDKLNKTKGVA